MIEFQTLWARVRERALNDANEAYDGEDISLVEACERWDHVFAMKSILTRLPGKSITANDVNTMVTAYENAAVALLAAAFYDNGYDADTDVQVADTIAYVVVETLHYADARPGTGALLGMSRGPFERVKTGYSGAPCPEQFRDAVMVATLLTIAITKV